MDSGVETKRIDFVYQLKWRRYGQEEWEGAQGFETLELAAKSAKSVVPPHREWKIFFRESLASWKVRDDHGNPLKYFWERETEIDPMAYNFDYWDQMERDPYGYE